MASCLRDKAAKAMHALEDERIAARSRLGLPDSPPSTPLPLREAIPSDLSISRTYWALVARGPARAGGQWQLLPGEAGEITLPVPSPSLGGGPARPALTQFRVRATIGGLSWVELMPMTGEKNSFLPIEFYLTIRHQVHCLALPQVGDISSVTTASRV